MKQLFLLVLMFSFIGLSATPEQLDVKDTQTSIVQSLDVDLDVANYYTCNEIQTSNIEIQFVKSSTVVLNFAFDVKGFKMNFRDLKQKYKNLKNKILDSSQSQHLEYLSSFHYRKIFNRPMLCFKDNFGAMTLNKTPSKIRCDTFLENKTNRRLLCRAVLI